MTFVVGSYQAVEHPGGGHRASTAGLWRGEDLRSLNEVAMTVLPADCADTALRAVESVAAVRHPHLLPVIDVCQDEDRVAVICPWPSGGRLAELVIRRGRLTAGETLTVLIPLARALAVCHDTGIRHGEVSPETVWFDGTGRPLLGSPAVSRLIADVNDGLPAGSRDVAPEVIRGEGPPGGEIAPVADVFSLGSVALFCLTGRSAWPADDPADALIQSAAGLWPDLPDDAGPPGLVAAVREMLRAEPQRRPGAASLAARLDSVGEPAPIAFGTGPTATPASADRWRGWSAAAARPRLDPAPAAGGRHADPIGADPDPDDDGSDQPRTPAPVDEEPPGDDDDTVPARGPLSTAGLLDRLTRGRAAAGPPTRRNPLLVRTGIALLAGLLVLVVALQVGVWWSGWEQPETTGAAGPQLAGDPPAAAAGDPNWSDVVTRLDAARGRALDAADPALLADVYLDGTSDVAAADAAVVAQLAVNGLRVVDGVHQIVSVTVDGATVDTSTPSPSSTSNDESVRLSVVDTLPAHPIVDAAGRQVGLTPARAEQRRILVLGMTDRGYRISSVEPG